MVNYDISDKWLQQGGKTTMNSNSGQTVSFVKSFKDTNYIILTDFNGNSTGDIYNYFKAVITKNMDSFKWYLTIGNTITANGKQIDWYVSGKSN